MTTPSQSHAVLIDELARARERIRQLEAERAIATAANDQRTHILAAMNYLAINNHQMAREELAAALI